MSQPDNMLRIPSPLASWVLWGRASPTVPGTHLNPRILMKKSTNASSDEPVGIVISGGRPSAELAPRFSAYIWAPAPEEESVDEVQAA
jgi:hypothetical protein